MASSFPSLNSVVGSISGEAGPTPSPLNWSNPIPFTSTPATGAANATAAASPLTSILQNVLNPGVMQNTSAQSVAGTGGLMSLAGLSVQRWVALILGTVLILIGAAALALGGGRGKAIINMGKKAALSGALG
jgi:hypothetical protein